MPERRTKITRRPIGDPSVLVLSLTTFAMGLSEFMVIGLMRQITEAYGVDLPSGGWLVATYALGISIGAPLFTLVSLDRPARAIAVLTSGGLALLSLACVIAPSFGWLLALRALAGVLHGVFFTVTTASLPTLFEEKRVPAALALMFSGLTVAMVLGVPLGMALAASYGWYLPFVAIALSAGAGAALLSLVLPNEFGATQTLSVSALRMALMRVELLRPYAFTVFGFGGGFAIFTYAEAWLVDVAGLDRSTTGLMLGMVGLGALIGNITGGLLPRLTGRRQALALVVTLQLAGLAGLATTPGINMPAPAFAALALLGWSVGAFATAPMVHNWAIETSANSNARIAAALNVTAFNLGLTLSSTVARWQVSQGGLRELPLVALLLVALALPMCLKLPTRNRRIGSMSLPSSRTSTPPNPSSRKPN